MAIQDKFGDLAYDKPVEIEIEGETLELDMDSDDIVPLMSMGNQQGNISEEDVEKMKDVFQRVLYRSYLPYWDEARDQEPTSLSDTRKEENEETKAFLDGLLVRKLPVMTNKIITALGWSDGSMPEDFPEDGNLQR
jgi:hypothetical protein